ncbi:MAG TPA: hypothetical protein PLR71_03465, partial [Deltaproteobacteria bacterium]|nr:hypothetical protein [Deltaproteobacteria bacterium]
MAMQTYFFYYQVDYLSFIIAFSLTISAIIFFTLSLDGKGRLPWAWAGMHCVIHGVSWLLAMLALSMTDTAVIHTLRVGLSAVSFLALGEFARRSLAVQGGPAPGIWIYPPLVLVSAGGVLAGIEGLDVSVRIGLGLPCGLAAAYTLWKEGGAGHSGSGHAPRLMRYLSLYLAGFVVLCVIAAPSAAWFLAVISPEALDQPFTDFILHLGLTGIALGFMLTTLGFSRALDEPSPGDSRGFSDVQRIGLVLAVVLVAGGGLCEAMGRHADSTLRKEILTQARIAARALNPERVSGLRGDPSDIHSINYVRLKEQIIDIRNANPIFRFMYLMGKRDGSYFFYLDSEPVESQDYSPPGQVYEEAGSNAFNRAFDEGKEIAEGPLVDAYGTWVSASIPVRDPSSGRRIMLGVDIDASDWSTRVFAARRQPILAIMFICLLAVVFSLEQRRSRNAHLRVAASEQRLRYALEATSEGIWEWNIPSGAMAYSPHWIESLGYSRFD